MRKWKGGAEMFNHINTFFQIVSTKNKNQEQKSYAPAYFVCIGIVLASVAIAARFSFSKYSAFLGSEQWGFMATVTIAIFMFLLTGFISKEYALSTFGKGSKKPVPILIFFTLLTVVLGYGDYWVNSAGANEIAKTNAGDINTIDFNSLTSSEDSQLEEISKNKTALTSGSLGWKYGWTDKKKIYHLNETGKKYLADLNSKESRLLNLKENKVNQSTVETNTLNADIMEKRNVLSTMFYYIVIYVYVIMLFASYLSEVIQLKILENDEIEIVKSDVKTDKPNLQKIEGEPLQASGGKMGFQQGYKMEKQPKQPLQVDMDKLAEIVVKKMADKDVNIPRGKHTKEKEIVLGNTHPKFTVKVQPDTYRGIDERKYKKFVKIAKKVLREKGKYNKSEIQRLSGISRPTINDYMKVALEERLDLEP